MHIGTPEGVRQAHPSRDWGSINGVVLGLACGFCSIQRPRQGHLVRHGLPLEGQAAAVRLLQQRALELTLPLHNIYPRFPKHYVQLRTHCDDSCFIGYFSICHWALGFFPPCVARRWSRKLYAPSTAATNRVTLSRVLDLVWRHT